MLLPVSDMRSLDHAMERDDYADYIYMYPPRQSYRHLEPSGQSITESVKQSLKASPDVNLYIHIPFCAQICRFCNLYTTAIQDQSIYDIYVDRVVREAAAYRESDLLPRTVRWRTFYLGGGTPSSLPLETLERLMNGLRSNLSISDVEETAIEVAPETITSGYLAGLKRLGFDRISMGFQSTSAGEIRSIGRSYPVARQADIASETMSLGFRNLCLDLIFGLPGQDQASWTESVRAVIRMRPQTICCYQWTSRPHTGFGKMGLSKPKGEFLRQLYGIACHEMENAGYGQESHVRWVIDGGGYLQKQYHWGMETLLGLGAGARSYLWHTDLRNGYSIRDRRVTLSSYLQTSGQGWVNTPEGFMMSDEERLRKSVVLGLHGLSRVWFKQLFGQDVISVFPSEMEGLANRGLLEISPERLNLTPRGMKHRDTIVQLFFSDNVRRLTQEWEYAE